MGSMTKMLRLAYQNGKLARLPFFQHCNDSSYCKKKQWQ